MKFFDKIFGKSIKPQSSKKNSSSKESEHAVIIRFNYSYLDLQPLYSLEDQLKNEIAKANVGEYDGHEISTDYSDGYLYLYGPNAEILFKTVSPILKSTDFMKGAIARLRFGPPEKGVKEIQIEI
jgi:hypothetical protein